MEGRVDRDETDQCNRKQFDNSMPFLEFFAIAFGIGICGKTWRIAPQVPMGTLAAARD